MSEVYRLVYSGEVLSDQHPAVVRKRLATLLKLDDEKTDVLFSGKAVVVKKAADEATASRYQQAFQKAGARLRVMPLEGDGAASGTGTAQPAPAGSSPVSSPVSDTPPSATEAAPTPASKPAPDAANATAGAPFDVMPAGTDVLSPAERPSEPETDIDTSHIKVQGAVFDTGEALSEPAPDVPNVDHITIAELGAQLGVGRDLEVVVAEIEVHFDLAELGAMLSEPNETEPDTPGIEVDFDIAAPGATLGRETQTPPPPPPDTSHLTVADDEPDGNEPRD